MKITIIGTGYVGLVSGICFAKIGHKVTCVDKDGSKIDKLNNGQIPIFEPNLKKELDLAIKSKNIDFTISLAEAVKNGEVIFLNIF